MQNRCSPVEQEHRFHWAGNKMLLIEFITTKTIKGIQHLSYEGRQKELGLLSPGLVRREEGQEENHTNMYWFLVGGYKVNGIRIFSGVSSEKRQQTQTEIQTAI